MAHDARDITRTHPDYRRRRDQWRKVRDALEGEERIKERGTLYLPRPRGQQKPDWVNYLTRSSFYGVADRTLRGLTGLVFRVDPIIEIPPALKKREKAITSEGFSIVQMLREGVCEVLSLGRYGVLVDMPTTPRPDNVPYLATYKAEDIFRWEEVFDPTIGLRRVVRIVVREEPEVFSDESTTILRELFLNEAGFYQQQAWMKDESEKAGRLATPTTTRDEDSDFISGSFAPIGAPVTPTMQGRPLDFIPFWFSNVYDHRARPQKPPFLDMVNMNLAHYRNSADYEQSLFLTAQPTPYLFGVPKTDKPKAIGAGTLWHSPSKEVVVGMLEFKGQGLNALKSAMADKEERMAALGARLIKDFDPPDNVAQETLRLMNRSETSVLLSGVATWREAAEEALQFAAVWAGAGPNSVSVKLNTDFIETRLSPEELTSLVAGWQSGAYSKRTLHENLQRGEIVPPDRDLEEEQELIDSEGEPPVPPGAMPPEPRDNASDDDDDDDTSSEE